MEKLCSDPSCEYCMRIRERGRYKYDAIHKCIDCGAIHAKGLRCRKCCNEHWKMIRKMARRKKPRPRCIDCGKEHTHGLRCGECCQKHSIEEWVRKNPEHHDFMAKMRTKLAMRLCTHCEKLFYTHCGKSTKRPIKCPLCGFWMDAKNAKTVFISRRDLRKMRDEENIHRMVGSGLEDRKDAGNDKADSREQGEIHGDSDKAVFRDRDSRKAPDAG